MDFIKEFPLLLKNRILKKDGLAKNSAVLFVGVMAANLLNYIFHLVIGRMVTIEEYGKIEALISFINIILIPSTTLMMIAAKFSAGFKAENKKSANFFFLKYLNRKIFLIGLPIFLIFVFLTPHISRFLKIGENLPLFFIWIFMLVSFLSAINSGTLRGWQKFKDVSALSIYGALVKLISGIILVKIGFSLNGAIGSITLGAVASYAISWFMLKFILKEKKRDGNPNFSFADIKYFIIPFFIGNLSINLLGNIDMALASRNLDSLAAGQYGALTVVSKVIFFATGVIATALFSMSAENHQKKTDTLSIFKKASLLMLGVSLCAIIFYFLFPNFILKLLFGTKYIAVSHYLGWFAIMVALFSYANLMSQYFLSIQKNKAVYGFFLVAILSASAVFLFGKNICDILKIMLLSQSAVVVIGSYFIFKKPVKIKNKI